MMGRMGGMGVSGRLSSTSAKDRVTDSGSAYAPAGQARSGVPVNQPATAVPVKKLTVPQRKTATGETPPLLPIFVTPNMVPQWTAQHVSIPRVELPAGPTDKGSSGKYGDPTPPPGYACLPGGAETLRDAVFCYRLDCTDARRGGKMELLTFRVALGQTGNSVEVKHFADFQTARAWAEEAQRLLGLHSYIDLLDSIRPSDTTERRREAYEAQTRYVRDIFAAIANVYNALNIPWSTDPVARALYRKWLAGNGGAGSETNKAVDYNGGNWYSKNEIAARQSNYPLVSNEPNAQQGILTRRARRFSLVHGRAPTHFRQLAGIRMTGPGSEADNPRKSPYVFAQQATNTAFAIPNGLGTGGIEPQPGWVPKGMANMIIGEDLSGWAPGLSRTAAAVFSTPDPGIVGDPPGWQAIGRIHRDAANDASAEFQDGQWSNDWRSYGRSEYVNATGVQQTATPLRDYLPWADEWVQAILARPMATILRQSREESLRRNMAWASAFGGSQGLAREIAGQNAAIEAELHSGNASDIVGATTSGLVRGIGAAFPGVGTSVANLVAGGIDAITSIFGALIEDGSIVTMGRDDLGNFKPIFERSMLAGTLDPNAGNTPPMVVAPPVWFCRDEAQNAQAEIVASDPPPVIRPAPPPSGIPTVVKVVGGVALTGTLVAGGIWALRKWL